MRWLFVILLVLLVVPGWSGDDRLPLLDTPTRFKVTTPPVTHRSYGRLFLVGARTFTSGARAFGGFSAIALKDNRATLLSDTGNYLSFAIRGDVLYGARIGYLPTGPGTGWPKQDRDTESLALDPATGAAWVGFEHYNMIWRFTPGFASGLRAASPALMARWTRNGGAESLARFPDGAFVTLAETPRRHAKNRAIREGIMFAGDPTDIATPRFGFRYRPPRGFSPSDAAVLPDGDLLVLNRRWRFPLRFAAQVTRVARASIRPGALVTGRTVASLGAPLLTENAEGIAISREHSATMVWIVTDNDQYWWRPTQLLKFQLR